MILETRSDIRNANSVSAATIDRRLVTGALAWLAVLVGNVATSPVFAQQKTVKVGIILPLTGADAEQAKLIKNGATMAFEEASAGGVGGHRIDVVVYDSGTATAGQYDPAQAATDARKLIDDPLVVAILGPENSGEGKAMAPILSESRPRHHHADFDEPRHYQSGDGPTVQPKGKAICFRTVTTDAFQGPNMANFYAQN